MVSAVEADTALNPSKAFLFWAAIALAIGVVAKKAMVLPAVADCRNRDG